MAKTQCECWVTHLIAPVLSNFLISLLTNTSSWYDLILLGNIHGGGSEVKGNGIPSVFHRITRSLAPICLFASGLSLRLLVVIVPHIPQCWYISWLIACMNSRGEEWLTSAMPSVVKIASRSVLRSKLPGGYLCCLMRLN